VWCGVVWCGVVWCGVVWCGGGRKDKEGAAERITKKKENPTLRMWGNIVLAGPLGPRPDSQKPIKAPRAAPIPLFGQPCGTTSQPYEQRRCTPRVKSVKLYLNFSMVAEPLFECDTCNGGIHDSNFIYQCTGCMCLGEAAGV
jgi:hypothetical protein